MGVTLSWINSSSNDVVAHLLYKRESVYGKGVASAEWQLVKEFFIEDSITAYADEDVRYGYFYNYTLLAIDDNGLESKPAPPINTEYKGRNPYPSVTDVFDNVDKKNKEIELVWKYEEHPKLLKFHIYRSVNEGNLELHTTLPPSQRIYSDSYSNAMQEVSYYVIAQFKDGYKTGFEKKLRVKLQK